MAIFKRVYREASGKRRRGVYWFNFWWNGEHIQKSTGQGNPDVARQMEAAYRTALAKGEAGIVEHQPAPTLKEFSQRFIDEIQVRCAAKPNTVDFYAMKLKRLLEFEPLASSSLDSIDESLIAAFVQWRSTQPSRAGHNRKRIRGPVALAAKKRVSPASINRKRQPFPGCFAWRMNGGL